MKIVVAIKVSFLLSIKCFHVIVHHAVYIPLNLRVNLKAYFPNMEEETMETRLTDDVA